MKTRKIRSKKSITKLFDDKFGGEFLAGLPATPGVYSIFSETGELIYVGKSRNLRRRLGQYRKARRRKRDRKMKVIVAEACRIEWETHETDLLACLRELDLIQTRRPKWNRAGAFSFLYPFVGVKIDAKEVQFCFTTSVEPFPEYEMHGAYRSREICGEAFFALMRLLKFVAHRNHQKVARKRTDGFSSYCLGYRQFPNGLKEGWGEFFRGQSPAILERLCLRLLDNAGARAKGADVQADLRALKRFYRHEALRLNEAIQSTGFVSYPVPQLERDPLFLRARDTKKPLVAI